MKQLSHEEFDKKQHHLSILIICDNLQSPANLGSIFRSAEAFGISKVFIHSDNELFLKQPRFIKTSRHSFKNIEVETYRDIPSLVEYLKEDNYFIVSLEKCDQSKRIQDLKFKPKTTIIVGNERSGLDTFFLENSNATAHIDMFGDNSSMNVSQALSIGLYECIRQQV